MKNYKIIAVLLLLIFASFGCNEDEFLNEVNPNAITTETFWKSEKQFQSGLTTVYGALQFQNISGGGLVNEMIMGDIGGTESWYRPTAFRNLTFNDGTYYVTDKWNEAYIGIFRANQVIQYIQEASPSAFSDNSMAEIEAQARFLRAFFYFQIAHSYGGAVMHTQVAENAEDLFKPFSTIADVTSSIIIPDLEFAKANLPESWGDKDTGRVTWGAATSMLGKIYLFDERWSEAAAEFKEVIDSGIYALTENVRDNYSHENEFNSESIFEVAYSAELNPGANGDAVDDSPFETGAEASSIARELGQLSFGAFNTLLPSYYAHELFVNDEPDPSKPINEGNMHSQRMSASIAPINGETSFYNLEIGARNGWAFGQSAYIKKHTNWYHLPAEDNNGRSGINFRHIRLADVYLMYAEAILEAEGDYETAIDYIDLIRSRAAVKTLRQYIDENIGRFPQLHISIQVNGEQPLVEPSTETVMTHLKRVERVLELCYEGHRWKDLVRWGMVQEIFDELYVDEVWREDNRGILQISFGGVAPLFIVERVRPDFFFAAQNYNSEQHDYFPIPTQERQTNPMIN